MRSHDLYIVETTGRVGCLHTTRDVKINERTRLYSRAFSLSRGIFPLRLFATPPHVHQLCLFSLLEFSCCFFEISFVYSCRTDKNVLDRIFDDQMMVANSGFGVDENRASAVDDVVTGSARLAG